MHTYIDNASASVTATALLPNKAIPIKLETFLNLKTTKTEKLDCPSAPTEVDCISLTVRCG
jgi:hypothetical protein